MIVRVALSLTPIRSCPARWMHRVSPPRSSSATSLDGNVNIPHMTQPDSANTPGCRALNMASPARLKQDGLAFDVKSGRRGEGGWAVRTRGSSVGVVVAGLVALASLTACGASPSKPTTEPTSAPAVTAVTTSVPPPSPTPAARTVNWFDLDVGDCLADPPPVDDPNVVGVKVVDCSTPHRVEVYLRAPLAVNTAVADVADRKCNEGFTKYTGEPVGSGTFSITYLIDSNQNRTSSNPNPSTVICLLQSAGGDVLTVPAQR